VRGNVADARLVTLITERFVRYTVYLYNSAHALSSMAPEGA